MWKMKPESMGVMKSADFILIINVIIGIIAPCGGVVFCTIYRDLPIYPRVILENIFPSMFSSQFGVFLYFIMFFTDGFILWFVLISLHFTIMFITMGAIPLFCK